MYNILHHSKIVVNAVIYVLFLPLRSFGTLMAENMHNTTKNIIDI